MIRTFKRLVRASLERLDRLALPLASAGRRFASAYYLVANPRFGREHRAVLAGRRAYYRGLESARRSSPLLRRNIHRLEKGLVMRPRHPVFAEEYIGETVEAYERAAGFDALEAGERRWAADVLAQYFAAVEDTPTIAAARRRFEGLGASTCPEPRNPDATAQATAWAPRARAAGARASVAYGDFLELCRQRRSVRWFLPTPVPRERVEQAIAAAAQAPSACNRQPFVFRYFDDPARAAEVTAIAMGTVGYSQNVPAVAVLLGDLSAYPEERDRHLIYIDGALAAMQFMLALETLGLASCPINWPDMEPFERRMARELGLPTHWRPVMLIALGYPDPDGGVPFSAKKPVDALLKLDDRYD